MGASKTSIVVERAPRGMPLGGSGGMLPRKFWKKPEAKIALTALLELLKRNFLETLSWNSYGIFMVFEWHKTSELC